ncbi:MAG TPA: chemotaxis protein, partial [Phenylobacterium sp.]
TQNNAAMVEQSTAASHGLLNEADQLVGLVSHFRTGVESAPPTVAKRRTDAPPGRGPIPQLRTTRQAAPKEDGWEEF